MSEAKFIIVNMPGSPGQWRLIYLSPLSAIEIGTIHRETDKNNVEFYWVDGNRNINGIRLFLSVQREFNSIEEILVYARENVKV